MQTQDIQNFPTYDKTIYIRGGKLLKRYYYSADELIGKTLTDSEGDWTIKTYTKDDYKIRNAAGSRIPMPQIVLYVCKKA